MVCNQSGNCGGEITAFIMCSGINVIILFYSLVFSKVLQIMQHEKKLMWTAVCSGASHANQAFLDGAYSLSLIFTG